MIAGAFCAREESPDSETFRLARARSVADRSRGRRRWATRLVTPGGCASRRAKVRSEGVATESATEKQTAGELATSAAGRRETEGRPVTVQRTW